MSYSLPTKVKAARMLLEHEGLAEASVGYQPLIRSADEWRSFVRMGDQFLDAIQRVVDAATAASEAEDQLTARRANADVSGALRQVTNVTGKAYGHFATGRESLYEYAKLFAISTKRSSTAKKPQDIKTTTDADLRKEIQKGATGLASGIRKMLDLGAKSQTLFRDAARTSFQAGEDIPEELAKKVVDMGLDFRDAVSVNVFARTNGIMRRAAELSKRSWELMMMEDNKLGWEAPWAHDPEIGGLEVL